MKKYLLILLLSPLTLCAQLHLAKIFTSNMMLQRDKPINIWGQSSPGEKITVRFDNQSASTTVKKDSTWMVTLTKHAGSTSPQILTITSPKQTISLNNILVGDIWIASGQSNMEWPMYREMHWKNERNNATQPLIRLNNPPPAGRYVYGVAYTDSLNRRMTTDSFYLWKDWQTCDSNTLRAMSAIAYYFAKNIVIKKGIPIGIINLSMGGAPLETFISIDALQKSKRFAAKAEGNWLVNNELPVWIRERGQQNVGTNASGFKDAYGLNHAYKPGFAFESGLKPLLNFPVTGVIWYQGESNSQEMERVLEYKDLLHLMIDDYRAKWKQPAMPFYWVQLSSVDSAGYKSPYWPEFRDEQRKLLGEVKNGGMAVSSDFGVKNNVHPTNKQVVGERLSRWALQQVYGENMTTSGPDPVNAVYQDGKVIISFRSANGLKTSDANTLRGFSIDGHTDAVAEIQNDKVIIKSAHKPEHVYYGWKPFTDANLMNAEDLPASTFKISVK